MNVQERVHSTSVRMTPNHVFCPGARQMANLHICVIPVDSTNDTAHYWRQLLAVVILISPAAAAMATLTLRRQPAKLRFDP
jgi:hypothetical protein